jgi:hypothetical protein
MADSLPVAFAVRKQVAGMAPILGSPEFWNGVWRDMQARIRERVPKEEHELWVNPSVLLRVLVGPLEMFVGIPVFFLEETRKTLVSVVDFALLQTWADAGISPVDVSAGMKEVLDTRGHQIHSIAYCQHAVLRECEMGREASVGSRHEDKEPLNSQTLLIGLPRNGKAIYKAKARWQMLAQYAWKHYGLGFALTAQPDEYQLSKISKDFSSSTTEAKA